MPKGCAFAPRCDRALKICLEQVPDRLRINDYHQAACWLNVKDRIEEGSIVLTGDSKDDGAVIIEEGGEA